MEGSLDRRSPADVLSEMQRRQASGVLTYRHDQISRQIHLDAGIHIRFAASNHPAESLAVWFLERGGLAEEQLRRATLEKRPQEFLGSTLARLGLIPPADLVELTEMHIRRIARAAMRMRGGACEFQKRALPLQDQTGGGVLTAEVLLEWTRDLSDPEWIRQRLGSSDSRVVRAARPPEGYQKIRLDPVEGYIMSRVDGAATIREICMVSPMGDEKTLGALLGLALAGVLEMPEGAHELPTSPGRSERGAKASVTPPPVNPARTGSPVRDQGTASPAASVPSAAGRPASAGATAPPARQAASRPMAAPSPSSPPPAAGSSGVQKLPAGQPAIAHRPGPIGLIPKQRVPLTGGRASRPLRRPMTPAPKPPRAAARTAAESAVDTEAEMLRRFREIHTLDLYQVLDVNPAATADVIRHSYYALARRLHPDTFHREDLKSKAEKVFGRITEAYSTLSHTDLREKYDQERQARSSTKSDGSGDAAAVALMNYRHGREQFEHGRLSEALTFLENACRQDPSRAEYFEYLGLAQSRNPRLRKQAEANLLRAIDLAPMSASARAHLGQLHERMGSMDKARDMYRKALEWDPANEIALKGLETEGAARKGILGLFSRK